MRVSFRRIVLLAAGKAAGRARSKRSKADDADRDSYSGFEGTPLERLLREAGVRRVFVGGLATDYCVRLTVLDAPGLVLRLFS